MNGKIKTSKIIGMLAAVFIAVMFLTSSAVVLAQQNESEPNDDFGDATYCEDGDVYEGNVDDIDDPADYYQIFLLSGETLTATMLTSQLDMDLYDYSQYWVDDSMSNDLGQPHIEYTAYSSGYYYIQVNAGAPGVVYTLEISVNDVYSGGSNDGEIYVGGDYVTDDPLATLPTMNVGDSVYWGGIKDIGNEFEQEIEDALQDIDALGFDVSYDINGGLGAYFGLEVVDDDKDIGDIICYDIAISGAIAVDIGLDASVNGAISEEGASVSVDGSGNGFVELAVNLDGHMYLTVDELAIAKIDLTITAEGHGELTLDVDFDVNYGTIEMSDTITADVTMDIEDVKIDYALTFDPPLDIYQFGTGNGAEGVYEGKTWYVPAEYTEVEGSLNSQGTVTYDVHAEFPKEYAYVLEDVPGAELGEDGTIDLSDTTDLNGLLENNDFPQTIPGGQYYGAPFTCSYASGDIFVIEADVGNLLEDMGYGTRQIPDVNEMISSAGFQFNKVTGLITGMTMDGEVMTETVTVEDVEDFIADPLAEVKSVTGGRSTGSPLLGILLIGVILIVVVVIVVVLLTKKKAPPVHQHPQEYQQQPPPPPPEYQQQQPDQYQHPPADQYQQPPPPPPPGQ